MLASKNAKPLTRVATAIRTAWRGLREWCGDAAYDRYLSSRATRSSAQRPLTAAEFYVERVNHRYSRPNRCC
ncbi:MAG TPA: YbdD/YjiX family protein [Candidatus Dormibacteraeota bacterium]|nr:YbdD/YjiX family protein [Candidatus Dormibacteraeota bacterium]